MGGAFSRAPPLCRYLGCPVLGLPECMQPGDGTQLARAFARGTRLSRDPCSRRECLLRQERSRRSLVVPAGDPSFRGSIVGFNRFLVLWENVYKRYTGCISYHTRCTFGTAAVKLGYLRGRLISLGIRFHVHLMDSSQLPIKGFRRRDPCMSRTAALTLVLSCEHTNRTGSRIKFVRNTDPILSFKTVPFGGCISYRF